MHIERCDLDDRAVCVRVHAIQLDAYRLEAELIKCWQMPGLTESIDDLAISRESFFGARRSGVTGNEAAGLGALVGVIATQQETDGAGGGSVCICISRLAVCPAHHRCGIGRGLVEFILAQRHPVIKVSTGSANAPARRLYEGLGFIKSREFFTPDGVTPLVEYRSLRA
jgi:GNAT superfamily N-acetyltransferase